MEIPHLLINIITTLLMLIILAFYSAESKSYTVGDGEGWDIGTNYMAWAQGHNFTAGDVLVFKYVKGQHNAYEVTKEVYRSCDVGNGSANAGVVRKYESGSDEVVLGEAREYWFICSFEGHCLGGMKFGVDVSLELMTPPNINNDAPPRDDGVTNTGCGVGAGNKFWALWGAVLMLLANLAMLQ
ncbi:hypothetical protein Sjap_009899 [Stephania japonica]|uniref:Phytocyanin domain-containing protein n=1 Tax=Stephania japonica TaxID=461633 RepID=A0AAP0P360_9MAGN